VPQTVQNTGTNQHQAVLTTGSQYQVTQTTAVNVPQYATNQVQPTTTNVPSQTQYAHQHVTNQTQPVSTPLPSTTVTNQSQVAQFAMVNQQVSTAATNQAVPITASPHAHVVKAEVVEQHTINVSPNPATPNVKAEIAPATNPAQIQHQQQSSFTGNVHVAQNGFGMNSDQKLSSVPNGHVDQNIIIKQESHCSSTVEKQEHAQNRSSNMHTNQNNPQVPSYVGTQQPSAVPTSQNNQQSQSTVPIEQNSVPIRTDPSSVPTYQNKSPSSVTTEQSNVHNIKKDPSRVATEETSIHNPSTASNIPTPVVKVENCATLNTNVLENNDPSVQNNATTQNNTAIGSQVTGKISSLSTADANENSITNVPCSNQESVLPETSTEVMGTPIQQIPHTDGRTLPNIKVEETSTPLPQAQVASAPDKASSVNKATSTLDQTSLSKSADVNKATADEIGVAIANELCSSSTPPLTCPDSTN